MSKQETPVAVLAGTYHDAHMWARRAGLVPRSWYFVSGPETLQGRRGGTYVITRGFLERPDARAVYDTVRINGMDEAAYGGG